MDLKISQQKRHRLMSGWDFDLTRLEIDFSMNAFEAGIPGLEFQYSSSLRWSPIANQWVRIYEHMSCFELTGTCYTGATK